MFTIIKLLFNMPFLGFIVKFFTRASTRSTCSTIILFSLIGCGTFYFMGIYTGTKTSEVKGLKVSEDFDNTMSSYQQKLDETYYAKLQMLEG